MKDICFILDENYKVGFLTCLYSLLKNNEGLRIHIVQIGDFSLAELKELKLEFNFEYYLYDSNKQYSFGKEKLHEHINNSCYHVLNLHEILSDLDEVVYMDCDTLVLGDISELLETDISNDFIAASYDIYPNGAVEKDLKRYGVKKENIFNTGVLKMNLKKIRETDINIFVENVNFNVSKNECGGDQYVLNAFFNKREQVKRFSCKFNFLTGYLYYNHVRKTMSAERGWGDDYATVFDNRKSGSIKIFHFITSDKPWKIDVNNTKFKNVYYQQWYKSNEELNTLINKR